MSKYGSSKARRNNIVEKHSIGIACIQFKGNKPEILMVQKRYTYAYAEFIHGKYPQGDFRKNPQAKNEIMRLLNGMTVEEKLDICSLDFERMWFRIWLNCRTHTQSSLYYFSKNRFEQTFLTDGGRRLKKMIEKSKNGHCVWEIPKGRKKTRTEPEIVCAIREFAEETNVSLRAYRLIPGVVNTYSFIDKDVKYVNTYYAAVTHHTIEPTISFNTQDQINEISDIRWMDIETIRTVDYDQRLEKFIKPIFNAVKKRSKIPT